MKDTPARKRAGKAPRGFWAKSEPAPGVISVRASKLSSSLAFLRRILRWTRTEKNAP